MILDQLGQCRYCDYEPIARTARFCPRCGGTSPYESDFPWLTVGVVAALLLAAAAGYLYFGLGVAVPGAAGVE